MVPDRQKEWTDGWTDGQNGRTDAAKTISLRLRRGITIIHSFKARGKYVLTDAICYLKIMSFMALDSVTSFYA